jgi:hypothetical protein
MLSQLSIVQLAFGPKRDKVVRGWRKLDDEAIRELYFSAEP